MDIIYIPIYNIINWIKPGAFLQPDWIEILTMDSVADVEKIKEVFNIIQALLNIPRLIIFRY